jgi:hypothetical protein
VKGGSRDEGVGGRKGGGGMEKGTERYGCGVGMMETPQIKSERSIIYVVFVHAILRGGKGNWKP